MNDTLGKSKALNQRQVAFIDNGVIQRRDRKDSPKGGCLLKAISQHFGPGDVDLGFSPFFWVELAGEPEFAVTQMDTICAKLSSPDDPKNIQEWLSDSLHILLQDEDNLGNLINEKISRRLQRSYSGFLPVIAERLVAAWNNGQKDTSFHVSLIRHLAIDRLAIRLKNSAALRKDGAVAGSAIIVSVAKLLVELPGLGPYRLISLVWDLIHRTAKFKTTEKYRLKEKRDLLDGDLVSRSVLQLDEAFKNPLILTSDKVGDFQSRRNRFVSTCLYINEKISEFNIEGRVYSKLGLIDSTVCFFSNDNTFRFVAMTNLGEESVPPTGQ